MKRKEFKKFAKANSSHSEMLNKGKYIEKFIQ